MIFQKLVAPLLLVAQHAQGAHISSRRADSGPLGLRAISFNIRYAAPGSEHEKPWDVRGPYVIDLLSGAAKAAAKAGAVPIIGLQEVLHEQLEDIESGFGSDWTHIGTGRDDGEEAGEYCPILYQKSVVKLLGSTQKWLSPTPDAPSRWPGAGSNRYVVVGVFEHRATGRRFVAANTHLDNDSREARVEGIKIALDVIRGVQEDWGNKLGVTLTGDFNSETGDDPEDAYSTVRDDGYLTDLYTLVDGSQRRGPYTTFSGFDPELEPEVEKRIDFIHVGPDAKKTWTSRRYQVLNNVVDGIYMSDHRAVVGDITLDPY